MPKLMIALFLGLMAAGSGRVQAQDLPPPARSASPAVHPFLWSRMVEDITKTANEVDGRVGVFIRGISSPDTFSLRGDEVFPAASTIKLALLFELYRQAESAKGTAEVAFLQDAYVLQAKDLVEDSSILGNLTPGTRLTNRDLAAFTVVVSDNSATNILIDRVGMDRVNRAMDNLGLKKIRLRRKMMDVQAARAGRENHTSPRELAELLLAIQGGAALGAESRTDLIRLLSTPKDGFLTRLLPEGLTVANKPGTLPGVRNDAGIILVKGQPFVIAVMASHLRDERQGEAAIARIAQRVSAYFEMAGATSPEGRVLGVLQVR